MNQFCLNDINYHTPVEEGQLIHTGLYSVEALKILRCVFAYESGFGFRRKIGSVDDSTPFHNGRLTSFSTWRSEQNYDFEKSIWTGIGAIARGELGEVCLTVKSFLWVRSQRLSTLSKVWTFFNYSVAKSLHRLSICLDKNYSDDCCDVRVYEPLRFRPGCYGSSTSNDGEPELRTYRISRQAVKELMKWFRSKCSGRELKISLEVSGSPLDPFANQLYMKKKAVEVSMAKLFLDCYSKLEMKQMKDSQQAWLEASSSTKSAGGVSWEAAKRSYKDFLTRQREEKAEWLKAKCAELAAVFPEEN